MEGEGGLIVALQEFQSVFQEDLETLENMADLEVMPWGVWKTSMGGHARGVMEDILWRLCQRGHGGHPLGDHTRGVMENILWEVMPWTMLGGGWKFGRCYGLLPM